MATPAAQCYFNKIKLFKSFTNNSYNYHCANIIINPHNKVNRREISTNTRNVSDNPHRLLPSTLPLFPSPSLKNRRQLQYNNYYSLNQLHWPRKNSFINGVSLSLLSTPLPLLQNVKISQQQHLQRKYYSSSTDNNTNEFDTKKPKRLPELMEFPKIVWPSIIKSIKNWILVNLIIRPYFDKDFDISDFSTGTRHALQVFLFVFKC